MKKFTDFLLKAVKHIANPMAISVAALAFAIFLLSVSITEFTIQVSLLRHDIPKAQDRLDLQIYALNNILVSAESTGSNFSTGINNDISSGINKGISSGIVDLPINTVKDVGGKLKETAVNTGNTTYGFWNIIKEKVFFWRPATKEAESKKPGK